VIVGEGAFARRDGAAVLSLAAKPAVTFGAVKDGWNGLCVLHTAASRVGALDIGFVPGAGGLEGGREATYGMVDVLSCLRRRVRNRSRRIRRLYRYPRRPRVRSGPM